MASPLRSRLNARTWFAPVRQNFFKQLLIKITYHQVDDKWPTGSQYCPCGTTPGAPVCEPGLLCDDNSICRPDPSTAAPCKSASSVANADKDACFAMSTNAAPLTCVNGQCAECEPGTELCVCADGQCADATLRCLPALNAPRCFKSIGCGNCPCDNGQCEQHFTCVNDRCVRPPLPVPTSGGCSRGAENCPCVVTSDGQKGCTVKGLRCQEVEGYGELCVNPDDNCSPGAENCPCVADLEGRKGCIRGLNCEVVEGRGELCVDPDSQPDNNCSPGAENCPCAVSPEGRKGCLSNQLRCQASGTKELCIREEKCLSSKPGAEFCACAVASSGQKGCTIKGLVCRTVEGKGEICVDGDYEPPVTPSVEIYLTPDSSTSSNTKKISFTFLLTLAFFGSIR